MGRKNRNRNRNNINNNHINSDNEQNSQLSDDEQDVNNKKTSSFYNALETNNKTNHNHNHKQYHCLQLINLLILKYLIQMINFTMV